ncbi:MAG: threonine/serine dehydratase [Thermoanaerobaculia bacterium]
MDLVRETLEAEHRLRGWVRETPVEPSLALGQESGAEVHLKLENFQRTGSFKIRGAMNKLLTLTPEERAQGVVAASSGNHGAAVADGTSVLGIPGTIFVPEDASPTKVATIRSYGTEVRLEGADCVVAELRARSYAEKTGRVYVSPYNDPVVVAGQGTVGLELGNQLESIDAVLVALGGGGLIAGIGGYLKSILPEIEIIACSPEKSAVMHASIEAGRILELDSEPTLSDGTAGGVEPGAITFDLCRTIVDRYVLVSEDEIASAMRLIVNRHHMLIEGAAGVPVAALLKEKASFAGKRVAVVLCGANISPEILCRVLQNKS